MTEGPEGALYYVDLGFADTTGQIGVSKIRRISFVGSNQPPVAQASANPTTGPTPLVVNFSSAGSSDPEGQPVTYAWNFGDNTTSTLANPTHTYTTPGPYQVRLTVSDGVNSAISAPLSISVGSRPTATILAPTDGTSFKAGDVITFSGSATDAEDGTLPASAYTWKIDFLHEGHIHPGTPITGVTSGTFTIPTTGHDFSGNTRYQVGLTVTDSSGLQSTSTVTVVPQKVNLNFATVPAGGTVFIDGIAHTGPFVYDTLVGFNHTSRGAQPDHRRQHIQLRLMVRRWRADSHHRRARGGANLHSELQCRRRKSTGFQAGECGGAADRSVVGAGHLHRRADRREHQYPGHRLEQRHLQYHLGD